MGNFLLNPHIVLLVGRKGSVDYSTLICFPLVPTAAQPMGYYSPCELVVQKCPQLTVPLQIAGQTSTGVYYKGQKETLN